MKYKTKLTIFIVGDHFKSTIELNKFIDPIVEDIRQNIDSILSDSKYPVNVDHDNIQAFSEYHRMNINFNIEIPVEFDFDFNVFDFSNCQPENIPDESLDEDRHLIEVMELSGIVNQYLINNNLIVEF